MYIAIAGNIGSGKTTLTRRLADHYGWTPKFESVEDNPYLADYYKDIPRWAFNMEVFFLRQRFKDMLAISRSDITVVQDRSIFEGVYIFAANNHDMGNMSDRDFDTYMGLFQSMMMVINQPDLLIYLRATVDHLVDNVHKRGRGYEQNMRLDYLSNLNERYDRFVNSYKGTKLVIDVNNIDFVRSRQDFADIVDKINDKLGIRPSTLF